ncbi:MAG: helix-turn-helix transcriptional regulator [Limosilactobacillus reuteri]
MSSHNRIKELRNKKGLSQKEFAKAFNEFMKNSGSKKTVSYATISRWERGENEPKLEIWLKLSDFFGVPVSYIQGADTYILDSPPKDFFSYFDTASKEQLSKLDGGTLADDLSNFMKAFLSLTDVSRSDNKKFWIELFNRLPLEKYGKFNDNIVDMMWILLEAYSNNDKTALNIVNSFENQYEEFAREYSKKYFMNRKKKTDKITSKRERR